MKQHSKVYMDDWLFFHPYEKPARSDFFYLRICQEIHEVLQNDEYELLIDVLEENEIKLLACFITSYFEDVISETGMWAAFINKHKGLYGKYLPFYNCDEDYYPDEINPEDVYFLLWYFLNHEVFDDQFISPLYSQILLPGDGLFNILDNYYETAPQNDKLSDYLNIANDETDFYVVRVKIEWLVMHSYLFHFYQFDLQEEMEDFLDEHGDDEDALLNTQTLLHDITDGRIFKQTTALLAMKGNEWMAEVLGKEHQLYETLIKIDGRKSGFFLYKGYDDKYLNFEHISTGKAISVSRESMDLNNDFKPDDTIVMMSVVNWMDEWWFSGIYTTLEFNADLILDEKNSAVSRGLFNQDESQIKDSIAKQQRAFMEFNNNSPLVFLSSGKKVTRFIDKFMLYYNNSLNISEAKKAESEKRLKSIGFFGGEEKDSGIPDDFKNTEALVYFNPDSGIEILFGFNALFEKNPKKEIKNGQVGMEFDFLMSDEVNTSLKNYFFENFNPTYLSFLFELPDENLFIDNFDFMLRFLNPENYKPKLGITLI